MPSASAVVCPACSDLCNPPGATVCGWCGFSPLPLTPGPYYGKALPAIATRIAWGRTTTIHAEVLSTPPSVPGKAPLDPGISVLLVALLLCFLPALFGGILVLVLCGGCSTTLALLASAVLPQFFRRQKQLAHFTAETVDGHPVTLLMVNPIGVISVGDRIIATGTRLQTGVFYTMRATIRSSGAGASKTCRSGPTGRVEVRGDRRVPLWLALTALVASSMVWLLVFTSIQSSLR